MTTSHSILDGMLYMTTEDNGNGTATRTFYRTDGTISETQVIECDPPAVDEIAELRAQVKALVDIIAGE